MDDLKLVAKDETDEKDEKDKKEVNSLLSIVHIFSRDIRMGDSLTGSCLITTKSVLFTRSTPSGQSTFT